MLANLHVKNFAIIDEVDIDFGKHLNILTGETGAGKSILVGSISIALGARVSPEIIGKNGDYAMVEAVFQIENADTIEKLRELDIEPEDGQIVISRKITENRSINKINGESVSVNVIKKVAALCIDIHGQHEHQSLLSVEKHMEIVDEYAGDDCVSLKEKIALLYREYVKVKKEIEQDTLSTEEQARQLSFLEYEKEEIESAALRPGEWEELEETYRRASNAGAIVEALSEVHRLTADNGASSVSHAIRRLHDVSSLDSSIENFSEELLQIEDLLNGFNRELSGFMADFSFDERERMEMERRLDLIHNLQTKYGSSYEEIMEHLKSVDEKLEKYADYEEYCRKRQEKFDDYLEQLDLLCNQLTQLREQTARQLETQISQALQDLNFAHVDFAIEISPKEQFTSEGKDNVEFTIATNPGEPKRSLGKVASGGELSRIMLAIKSVFAENDQIETLIFDEIDVGISGRTAQKVSEKMSVLGKHHQILCITHLAQIAAMADYHFVIEKEVKEDASKTQIRPLSSEEMEEELARILGGVEITDAVFENAREMKAMANELKQYS